MTPKMPEQNGENPAPAEPPRLVWMALHGDLYDTNTANADPKAAALESFTDFGDDEPVTVAEFKVSDVTAMLPDDLFDGFLEGLADSLIESYIDYSAEGEMLDSLYGNGSGKTPGEVNALLRPVFEAWWRTHAAGFGVDACYTATGRELTYTAEELKAQEAPMYPRIPSNALECASLTVYLKAQGIPATWDSVGVDHGGLMTNAHADAWREAYPTPEAMLTQLRAVVRPILQGSVAA